ncbi:hypothetical protein ACKWTF_007954 [Chironomus riparius]
MSILNFILLLLFIQVIRCKSIISGLQKFLPPPAKYGTPTIIDNVMSTINGNYEWEKSGLFEGDIALYDSDRNALISHSYRWPNATIPFYIQEKDFNDEEVKTILLAIKEFHSKTCLRLKPYELLDENWVIITGNDQGCYSSVGMRSEGGQQLNLHTPGCVRKGVVQHELLHAAGFYHQQSSSDRDEYVEILWDNIENRHAGNFKKYNSSIVTDYGIGYDYDSIMHYSSKAFSRNGNATIVAKKNVTRLGQRDGFTEKDILKLNSMYEESCHNAKTSVVNDDRNDSELDVIN